MCNQGKGMDDFYPYCLTRCKDCKKKESRRWSIENKDRVRFLTKRWNNNNKDIIRGYNKYSKQSEQKKLEMNLRNRFGKIIKRGIKGKVSRKKIKYLGCTTRELIIFLESKFKDGMSWDNYGLGGWHIDHIKPLCSFNLKTEEGKMEAFHFTNLQPLWKDEHRIKSLGERRSSCL